MARAFFEWAMGFSDLTDPSYGALAGTDQQAVGSPNPSHQSCFLRGNPLRFVFAKSTNCCSLIEFTIWRDAPLRLAFDRSPRLAASAAPAAICCFFDLAGIY